MTDAGDRARKALRDLTEAIEQLVKESGGESSPAILSMFLTQMESMIGLMELKPSGPKIE